MSDSGAPDDGGPLRVCFLIRSLDPGGAERQLVELVKGLDPVRFRTTVLTFYGGGALETELAGTGIELVSLAKRGRWDMAGFLCRAYREIAARRPHIVHGYLGVANEIALVLGRAAGAQVIWGVRASYVDLSQYDWTFRASLALSRRLSRFVDLVIYNSAAGARAHRRQGYRPKREAVIPNGIDVVRFRHDPEGRIRVRQEWGVAPDERLVGIVGRIDPMKAHAVYLEAAMVLQDRDERHRFVCIGAGTSSYATGVRRSAAAARLADRLRWAGPRADMTAVYSALDCLVLTSIGEGMPNVVAEAMACEVPCVVTDVGDSASVVGETGFVRPVGDARGIAEACHVLLAEPAEARMRRRQKARARIANHYSLARLASRTAAELETVVQGRPR